MKTTFKTIAILIVSLLLYNCGSDETEIDTEEVVFLKAKIDGEQFESNFPILQQLTNTLSIGATTDNQDFLQIYIADYSGPGTYTTGSSIVNENVFSYGSWIANKDYESGTVTINKNGNILTGTFSFTGFNFSNSTTKTITNGSFKVLLLN